MNQCSICRVTGAEAYDLIYQQHLSTLSADDQDTMRRHMINSSRIWLGFIDDRICGCCGIIPPSLLSGRAYMWLYTTEHFVERTFTFVRYSQRVIEEALRDYPLIVGHTRVDAEKSIRWLRWLGAVYGAPDGPVIPFEIRAKS